MIDNFIKWWEIFLEKKGKNEEHNNNIHDEFSLMQIESYEEDSSFLKNIKDNYKKTPEDIAKSNFTRIEKEFKESNLTSNKKEFFTLELSSLKFYNEWNKKTWLFTTEEEKKMDDSYKKLRDMIKKIN